MRCGALFISTSLAMRDKVAPVGRFSQTLRKQQGGFCNVVAGRTETGTFYLMFSVVMDNFG